MPNDNNHAILRLSMLSGKHRKYLGIGYELNPSGNIFMGSGVAVKMGINEYIEIAHHRGLMLNEVIVNNFIKI